MMPNDSITVLYVEDNSAVAMLVQALLEQAKNFLFRMERVETLSKGLARLSQGGVDLVLLDLNLPDSDGFDTFSGMHSQFPTIPIIALTGSYDQELAAKTVQEGAKGFLVKGDVDPGLLTGTIRNAVKPTIPEQ